MPSPKDPSACMSSSRVRHWKKDEKLAGLEPEWGRSWHSLRRKFASDFMDLPLKVLCELGGGKTAQTVLQCYQRPYEDRLIKGSRGVPGCGFRVKLAKTICLNRTP